jgi:hypothetical protein
MGLKKKKADSPAVVAAPVPVVASASIATAPKKKSGNLAIATSPCHVVAPDSAAAPPVEDSPAGGILSSLSKRNKAGGTVAVAAHAPVVSVAPSVEPALKK